MTHADLIAALARDLADASSAPSARTVLLSRYRALPDALMGQGDQLSPINARRCLAVVLRAEESLQHLATCGFHATQPR